MVSTAVILAAGVGSKMFPYGDTWAKAALPVANKPIIQWQTEALKACGIEQVVVVAGHLGSQIRAALSEENGIQYLEQFKPTGTANALLQALPAIQGKPFVVTYGDILFTQEDLQRVLDVHADRKQACAMVQSLADRQPSEWLCANIENHQIKQILGHPREASHRLCGLYVLDHSIHPFLQENPGLMTSVEVGNMPPVEAELAETMSAYIAKGNPVYSAECQYPFEDIDKPWHYLDANTSFTHYLCGQLKSNSIADNASVSPDAQIDGFVSVGEHSIISADAKIKGNLIVGSNSKLTDGPIIGGNTVIGNDCSIHEYCKIEPNSSIGNHCIVGHAAEFGGILMDGAYSYHYGEYWGIIGRSSDLGAATVCGTLRFDDQATIHRVKGRREITRSPSANASYLGDYVRTGVNAILMPGVKVGAYSVIGSGVILNEDVPKNTALYVKQELIRSTWGPEKYGW